MPKAHVIPFDPDSDPNAVNLAHKSAPLRALYSFALYKTSCDDGVVYHPHHKEVMDDHEYRICCGTFQG